MNRPTQSLSAIAVALAFAFASDSADAHMAWLASDKEGHAIFWFGESPAERTYHLPEKVAAIELRSTPDAAALGTRTISKDDFVGLRSEKPIADNEEVSGTVVYGLYHGMKLTYHVEHLPHIDPKEWPSAPRAKAALQSIVTLAPSGGVAVTVLKQGEPVADATLKLFCEEGHEEAERKTDASGRVTFTGKEVEPGLNALLVGIRSENDPGTLDGAAYKSSADYLTATFFYPGKKEKGDQPKAKLTNKVPVVPSGLTELPEELTSFGAAIADNKLYVYGGHTGEAHSYSIEEQSNRLWSLDLAEESASWETIDTDDRLQGLALVAWKDRLVRLGGFTAVNEKGDEQNLQSQARVAVFDPKAKAWSDLAALPEPRSSFDAAVLGDTLYVAGGWQLSGDSGEAKWHDTAYSLDLSNPDANWKPLPKAPFKRRALSLGVFDDKLAVIGGMRPKEGPTTRVDFYDPAESEWTLGPSLPGGGMLGFGSSAFPVGDCLYVSTMDGKVHKLSPDAKDWETIANADPARFFHRMLAHEQNLLLIGGANMEIGKFTEIDRVQLSAPNR